MVAAILLVAVYLGVISVAQGPAHAFEQLAADILFVGAIAIGFGIQLAASPSCGRSIGGIAPERQ